MSAPTPEAPAAPPQPSAEPPKKKRGGCLKIALGIIGAFIVLGILVNACGGGDETSSTSGAAPNTAASASDTGSPVTEPGAPEPTRTASAVKPKTYSGYGSRIVKMRKPSGESEEPVIASFTHSGAENFAVWTLDESLEQNELLVNTIGRYSGTVAMDFEEGSQTRRVQIEADGAWKMTIKPVTSARSFSSKIRGTGDDVVIYASGPKVADLRHKGSENFAIWYYSENGTDLLVNDIGSYSGQSALTGNGILVITADGAWSISAN